MGYIKQVEVNGKEIEVRRPQKKIRHILPRNRKKNHLIIMLPVDDENVRSIVKTEIKKMTRRLDHLLSNGMSFELHYWNKLIIFKSFACILRVLTDADLMDALSSREYEESFWHSL